MSSNSAEDKQEDGKITRRDFMKLIGAAGALATLPTLVPFVKYSELPQMRPAPIRREILVG
jgi:hypothetical protein